MDRLGDELCLDLARVYASGYSDGADAVGVLACAMDDRIAAFAATGGVVDLGDACEQGRPVPLLGMHSRRDEYARFEGGFTREDWNTLPISKELGRLPIPDRLTQAAVRNGCGTEPTIDAVVEGVERWRWPCPVGAEIELVLHPGGHSWRPGTTEMDVNGLVWESGHSVDARTGSVQTHWCGAIASRHELPVVWESAP